MKHVIIGTAGHIDHGKSSLVLALTGTDPDRWKEEKRRGITIDLGFAFLDLDDVRIGFVDVPGHERFVKNMLAGAGGIDVVLLIIAADEGIKPQTREHFDICHLLAIPRGLVVLTKSDLVDEDTLALARLEVEEFVRASFLESAPIIPVSAKTGAGLDRFREELRRIAGETPAKDASRHFRLPIDRSFAMKGFGAVVTGTLLSGAVAPEDEVELFPAQRRLRVRGIQSGGAAVKRAMAGQRTAINLAGIGHEEIVRGMTLATPGKFAATARLDARITLLPSARRLKTRTAAHFHHGTAETTARVVLLDGDELAPGQSALAQVLLEEPLLVLPGDRFILRQFSPMVTIGGGVVLDALAPRHKARDRSYRASLEDFERGGQADMLLALALRHSSGLDSGQIVASTGWMDAEVAATVQELAAKGKLAAVSSDPLIIVAVETLDSALQAIAAALDQFHKAHPLLPGIPKEDLRERAAAGLRPEVYKVALERAVAANIAQVTGDLVKRAGREITLLPEEILAKEQIEAGFAKAGLTVPPVKDVLAGLKIDARRAQKIVQILLREQTLVKVSEDLLFHHAAIARLHDLLAQYKQRYGARLPVPAFKELAGISRKYAIPLLEYLDRERITRRAGDERVIL
jgi:selenocysteine-specific elongation factor